MIREALDRAGRALDAAVNVVSPERGLRRRRARLLSVAYEGASSASTTLRNWLASGGSADADLNFDLPTLRERSRDLIRNNPLARGAVETVVTKVVSTGLSLQCRVDIETLGWTKEQGAAFKKQVEREWLLFSESPECDITRRHNFYALQALALRSALASGDCFALLTMKPVKGFPYFTRVQLIEGDRVANPQRQADTETLSAGVEMDEAGAPIAYHILKAHPGAISSMSRFSLETDRIPAFGELTGRRNVIHLGSIERPGQTRGAPYLSPVVEALKQLKRYTDASLMDAVVQSFFSVAIENAPSPDGLLGNEPAATEALKEKTLQMGHGNVLELPAGTKASAIGKTSPNHNFDPFVLAVLRQVGVALELPFEVLVKHFTASYSAARAAMLEAWHFFRLRREWLAANFCDPVYEGWMDEAVALGRVDAPGYFSDPILRKAYLRSGWIGDAPGSVDPVKEVQAAELRLRNRLSTHEAETMALTGQVWDETVETLAAETDTLRKKGLIYDPHPEAFQEVDADGSQGAPSPEEEDTEREDQPEDEQESERRGLAEVRR